MFSYETSMFTMSGLSDDGTGSSNSINDPTFNGDLEPHVYAPEAIPEESSG